MKTSKLLLRLASGLNNGFYLKTKSCKIGFIAIFLLLALTGVSSAATINVNAGSSIQDAINSANVGDTILVAPGTYNENIDVNKQLIIQSTGGASQTTISAASSNDHTIDILADGVRIDGFTISGANYVGSIGTTTDTYIGAAGIHTYECDNVQLSNNIVTGNFNGIYMFHSEHCTLRNNTMRDNERNFGLYGQLGVANDVDTTNTVNGKPIYYLIGESGRTFDSSSDAGLIILVDCTNIVVKDLSFSNNLYGIYLHNTINSQIENLDVSDTRYAIALWYDSDDNSVIGNTVSGNEFGVSVHAGSDRNLVKSNTVTNTVSTAVQIYSTYNEIIGNTVTGNTGHGISIDYGNNNVAENTVSNNGYSGIFLTTNSVNCVVTNNEVSGNKEQGIVLKEADKTTVSGNTITNNGNSGANGYTGIYVKNATNNLIYNNKFNNVLNAYFVGTNTGNSWSTEKTAGTNIVGGSYLGGNYWANPSGTGFSETGTNGGDGFCNAVYTIAENNVDYLPLTTNEATGQSAPVASITSISPNPAEQGTEVTFSGTGTDSDGTIATYSWTSSIDGVLSDAASFSTSSLSAGTHTIYLIVQDNSGTSSSAATQTLIINSGSNAAPVATIGSVSSDNVMQGAEVTFSGTGTDSDGTVTAYRWTSSIDGDLSNAASFSTSSLSAGTHTVSFTVQDNSGTWSAAATTTVTVNVNEGPNVPPVASIQSIAPGTVIVGNSVSFSGSGTDSDGTIAAYNWTSSIDGQLSTSAIFSKADLSTGTHTISFCVQDNDGAWSDVVSQTLTVNAASQTGNDSTAPVLVSVSPSNGLELDEGTTSQNIVFNYNDTDTGINTNSVVFTFDYVDVTGGASITDSSAQYSATGLSEGSHVASVYVVDNAGNAVTFTTSFTIKAASSSSSGSSGSSSGSSSSGSSSRKSSSSGGGGGGSTGEKYANILVKGVENAYVYKDKHIVYQFSEEGNAITSVQFDGLKNYGSIKTIVEVLSTRSSFADTDAPGKLYQQMNIWVGNTGFVTPENVENLTITFKVEKSWFEGNNTEKEDVSLYRYSNDAWNALTTTITGEDNEYVYYQSETPGFSPFAISAKMASEVSSDVSPNETIAVVEDEELMSVTDEEIDNTVAPSSAESSSEGFGKAAIYAMVGLLGVLLVGGYILYGRKEI